MHCVFCLRKTLCFNIMNPSQLHEINVMKSMKKSNRNEIGLDYLELHFDDFFSRTQCGCLTIKSAEGAMALFQLQNGTAVCAGIHLISIMALSTFTCMCVHICEQGNSSCAHNPCESAFLRRYTALWNSDSKL